MGNFIEYRGSASKSVYFLSNSKKDIAIYYKSQLQDSTLLDPEMHDGK